MTTRSLQQAAPLADVLLQETARVPRDVMAAALAMMLAHVCRRAGVPVEQVRLVLDAALAEELRLSSARAS